MEGVPVSICAPAVAAVFVLHGLNSVAFDNLCKFHGEWKDKPTFPWKFVYLTVQSNTLVLLYGLVWFAEIFSPGCTGGLPYRSPHLIMALGSYIFINYYGLVHFNPATDEDLQRAEERGELICAGKKQNRYQRFRIMQVVHAPHVAIASLPLSAIDWEQAAPELLSIGGTIIFACCWGFFYDGVLILVKSCSGFWVYPFLYDFTWQQRAMFYLSSPIFYGVLCLTCRAIIVHIAVHLPKVLLDACNFIIFGALIGVLICSDGGEKKDKARGQYNVGEYKQLGAGAS